jgi:regulator of protease activity HflC (stomatin/prohibitin superfamily)
MFHYRQEVTQMEGFVGLLSCALPVTALLLILFFISGLRVLQEYERSIVFRLGRYTRIAGPGLYWLFPLLEWQRKVDIRTVTVAVERQETITKDSVTVKIDAVVWYRIINPAKAIISVADYRNAVHQVALTSLRNIIGQHVLDEVLKERDTINRTLQSMVDASTEPWGIKIEAVEMKDVEIPTTMQRAMAQEAEAVREKRARLIKAEAELEASVKLSQGAKQMAENPVALELRRMQMISEVGAEQNSTTIILMPSDFVTLAHNLSERLAPPAKPSAPVSLPNKP